MKKKKTIKIEYRGFTITLTGILRNKEALPSEWTVSIYDNIQKQDVAYKDKKQKIHDAEIEAKAFIERLKKDDD